MGAREFLERLTGANRVYGEPYEKDGVTVIPVSVVRAGGGFGSGSGKEGTESGEGGGGGVVTRPVGAYVIRDGQVRWEPAIDVTRIALGGQMLVGLVLIALRLLPPPRQSESALSPHFCPTRLIAWITYGWAPRA